MFRNLVTWMNTPHRICFHKITKFAGHFVKVFLIPRMKWIHKIFPVVSSSFAWRKKILCCWNIIPTLHIALSSTSLLDLSKCIFQAFFSRDTCDNESWTFMYLLFAFVVFQVLPSRVAIAESRRVARYFYRGGQTTSKSQHLNIRCPLFKGVIHKTCIFLGLFSVNASYICKVVGSGGASGARPPHSISVPPISRLAHRLLHTSNAVF